MTVLISSAKLGQYEIQSSLDAGGMGEVYRARDTRPRTDGAIKVLHPHLADPTKAWIESNAVSLH